MPASVLTELIVAKEKQFCPQRHGGICLHIGIGCPPLSRYLSSKRHRANRAFALEWKDTTGSEWYCLSWVTSRQLHCCAILFPKLDFLKVAPIVWFSYLSQQLQSAWIAQQLIDPTAQKEVCETLLVTWIICIFANSGCFFLILSCFATAVRACFSAQLLQCCNLRLGGHGGWGQRKC